MNRRLTPAWRASAAIVSGSPASRVAPRAVITRPALSAESSRRRATSRLVCSAAVSSAMVNLGGCGQFDGGEEHWRVLADHASQLGGEADGKLCSLGADGGDGCPGGGAVVLVQAGDHFVVGAQQPADGVDLFLGGSGVAAGPVGQGRDGGGQPFSVGEQLGEVAAQLGGVGGVGAEVLAAGAAVPERTGVPASGDVGGFGADPERHRHLADLLAGRIGVGQDAQPGAHPPAAGVDLQRAEAVLGVAFAFRSDTVVPERGADRVVAEQLLEGVHGGTGISVTLGKGVPERVGEHPVARKGQQAAVGAAVGPVQVGQRGDPDPHRALQGGSRQGLGAVGVGQGPREQREPVGRRVGKRCPYPGLLCGDDGRLPVVDRQPATVFADLGHVVHEHRAGSALPVLVDVFVVVQALEAQRAQLAGAPPDTGELCSLRFEGLDYDEHVDEDGQRRTSPVLVHDMPKVGKHGCRLPIHDREATIITAQQARVRATFPDTPTDRLALFPRPLTNPDGTKALATAHLQRAMRIWVAALPDLDGPDRGADGRLLPFARDRVFPYAFRHTFAQRHADAGTPVDTLKELLGHDTVRTTLGYYRVGAKRKRDAQDRLGPLQIDARGRRVRPGLSVLSDTEAAREQVGQVAVPFGICTEPANVDAGGHSCPFRHRCTGCEYFRTDPSYTPELRGYLAQLLTDRERLTTAVPALADWARRDAAPSEEEIDAVRRLLRANDEVITGLDEDDRAAVETAITTIRTQRAQLDVSFPAELAGVVRQNPPVFFPTIELAATAQVDHG